MDKLFDSSNESCFALCVRQLVLEYEVLQKENARLREELHLARFPCNSPESAKQVSLMKVDKPSSVISDEAGVGINLDDFMVADNTSPNELQDEGKRCKMQLRETVRCASLEECIPNDESLNDKVPMAMTFNTLIPSPLSSKVSFRKELSWDSTGVPSKIDEGKSICSNVSPVLLEDDRQVSRILSLPESLHVLVGGQRTSSITASTVYGSRDDLSESTESVISPKDSIVSPSGQRRSFRMSDVGVPENPSFCYRLRGAVWNFMERPDGGPANLTFNMVSNAIIIISVCSPIINSTNISEETQADFQTMDTVFTIIFSIDLILKLSCCPNLRVSLTSFYTLIDILVVLAGWINFAFSDSTDMYVELIATIGPILRLLKIARHSAGWRLLLLSIKICMAPLMIPLYLMLLMVVFSGSLHYWIDRHFACIGPDCLDSDAPAFESIPHAMWYVVVTVATIGYGDVTPHSVPGKVLASFQIVCGVCYMAMPLAVIGTSFSHVWEDRHRLLMRDKLLALSNGLHVDQVIGRIGELFKSFDTDGSGAVEVDEFQLFMESLELKLPNRIVIMMFNAIDVDGSKEVTLNEFIEYVFPERANQDEGNPSSVVRISRSLSSMRRSIGSGQRLMDEK